MSNENIVGGIYDKNHYDALLAVCRSYKNDYENAQKQLAELKAENERLQKELGTYKSYNIDDERVKVLLYMYSDYTKENNELKQQLKEKDEEIIHYKEEEQKYKREIDRRDKKIENQRIQLKTNTKQVCEKIRENAEKQTNMLGHIRYAIKEEILSQIEKGEQSNAENGD